MTASRCAEAAIDAHLGRSSRFATRLLVLAGTTSGLLLVVGVLFAQSGLLRAAAALCVIAVTVGLVLWLVARYVAASAETDAVVVDGLRRELSALQAQRVNDLSAIGELRQQLHRLTARVTELEQAALSLRIPDAPVTGDAQLDTLALDVVEALDSSASEGR